MTRDPEIEEAVKWLESSTQPKIKMVAQAYRSKSQQLEEAEKRATQKFNEGYDVAFKQVAAAKADEIARYKAVIKATIKIGEAGGYSGHDETVAGAMLEVLESLTEWKEAKNG